MAINPSVSYSGKTTTPDANYPYGGAQNITSPGDGTGTPWEAALVNDIFGFQQELLSKANITPTGNPEKVNASQYLDSLRNILGANVTTLNAAGSPYTLTQAQAGYVIVDASAGAVTITLPAANVIKGINYKFIRIDSTPANAVTINRAGSDLIDGATSLSLIYKVPVYLDSDNASPGNWYNTLTDQSRVFQQTSVTMATNAVTISALNSAPLQFRSPTLTTGTLSTVSVPSANLVIPAGATLGTVNGIQSTIVIAEMNNSGTREYAVANISGGLEFGETGVISTTAISAAAGSANVWYSTTGRANLPYRIVCVFQSTQATAGQWATSPTLVQAVFGQAFNAMYSAGFGQTWQDVAAGRVAGTIYYNPTARPIKCSISFVTSTTSRIDATVNGISLKGSSFSGASGINSIFLEVPPGGSYSSQNSSGTSVISAWAELR